MPVRWQDPFVVWAVLDSNALAMRADRARETARDVRVRNRRLRRQRHEPVPDEAAAAELRRWFDDPRRA